MTITLKLVHGYRVTVHYREPTYSEATGTDRTYTWTWKIDATSEAEAITEAHRTFKGMSALSSVNWIREIVQTQVTRA